MKNKIRQSSSQCVRNNRWAGTLMTGVQHECTSKTPLPTDVHKNDVHRLLPQNSCLPWNKGSFKAFVHSCPEPVDWVISSVKGCLRSSLFLIGQGQFECYKCSLLHSASHSPYKFNTAKGNFRRKIETPS